MAMMDQISHHKKRHLRASPFGLLCVAIIAVAAIAPILAVMSSFFQSDGGEFLQLPSTNEYALGTFWLSLLVGIGASLIGVPTAMLVALTSFPGRRFLSIALVLPFSIPAYITAYTYADFLSPFGVGAGLGVFEIRSVAGAAFILTLSVYPYIYLAVRASLGARSGAFIEAARSLGISPPRAFVQIFLPAGRAAFAGGLALALMETAADYGVSDYFGVKTLSTGIFRTWYGLGNLTGASQLAAGLFLLALLLVALEKMSRRGRGADDARALRGNARIKLSATSSLIAIFVCALPIVLGFLLPIFVLGTHALDDNTIATWRGLSASFFNTAFLGFSGAATTIFIAIFLAFAARNFEGHKIAGLVIQTATLGYALPGAVIAIGILTVVTWVPGLTIVNAGIALLIYAYTARFLTAGYSAVTGGLTQINRSTDAAAKNLGAGSLRIMTTIHLPLNRKAIAAGGLIVFVDIMKELPATLLLQPFNYQTIATRIYRLASDERLSDAAPAALLLIFISTVAVILLDRVAGQEPH